jgi:tetratricopeptide (TPR) repeat protein
VSRDALSKDHLYETVRLRLKSAVRGRECGGRITIDKEQALTMTERCITRTFALAVVVGLGWPALAGAADPGFATLEAVGGQVVVVRLGQSQPPTPGMALQIDDVVVTKRGRASVRFHSDGTVLRIGPDSRVQVNESATQRDITVFFGRLWAHVVRWKERPTRFATSGTIAAVRGTEVSMAVETDGDRTQLAVLEGLVNAQNDAGSLELKGGQTATARKGTAPVRGVAVRPKDAVQWALYYLPVVYAKPGDLGPGAAGEGFPWQAKARESAEAFGKGELERAITSLEGVDDAGIREAKFFTYRASLLLATGNVEEAGKDLDRALKLAENDANALALQSIIAVARNETDKALTLARRSASAAPKASTPQIALSYAEQARFDLEGAQASLETAVQLEPQDALAWARLAEIRSSLGRLDSALDAAGEAAKLTPNLSRAQTVLGYAYLTQVRTGEAKAAFEGDRARPVRPLPRLGLVSRRSATASLPRAARRSRWRSASTRASRSCAATWARPTSRPSARTSSAGSTSSPSRRTRRTRPRTSTTRSRSRRRTGRSRRWRMSRRPSSSTTTGQSTGPGCFSTLTSPRAAPASGASTRTWASRTWASWKAGTR